MEILPFMLASSLALPVRKTLLILHKCEIYKKSTRPEPSKAK